MTSLFMVTTLRHELDKDDATKGLCPLTAQYNRTGNIILSFPKGTDRKLVESCHPAIRRALGLAESVLICKDLKWTKLVVTGVPTDVAAFAADLNAEFQLSNPQIVQDSKVLVTLDPRWVKDRPQVVFAIEGEKGASASRIIAQGVRLFGRLCHVREFTVSSPRPATLAT
jgi:hypothetical protein